MRPLALLLLAGCSAAAPQRMVSGLQSPEEFFGHRMGEDRKLARWDRIVEYFRHLDEQSDRIQVFELGKSTLGKPFVMAAISTPANLAARDGKVVVLFTCALHSSEIGSSQTAPELAYELVRGKLPLDDVIVLLMPSINPDGQEMIVDWYRKQLGTEFEGGPMPWLYHVYAGHDNNRDFYALNLQESRLVSDVFYKTWKPHVIVDHHQMGQTGARMFVPPYDDPVSTTLDPMLSRWLNVFGTHIALDLEAAGRKGVTHQDTFSAYWIGGAMRTPWWVNRIGILTETASARIATPTTVDLAEATDRKVKIMTPDPWRGGTWRLRDVVDYQLDASFSIIRTASKHRKEILDDLPRMDRAAVEAGRAAGEELHVSGPDLSALHELSRILSGLQVEHRVDLEGIHIPLARPYARLLLELFGKQTYPPGDKPYDVTAWSLSWLLGLTHEIRSTSCPPGPLREGKVDSWEATATDSFRVVNYELRRGAAVHRASDGTFVVAPQRPEHLKGKGWKLSPVRLGLYKPWTASMDEGWTRLVLERFEFGPVSIENKRIKGGKLRGEFDCIIMPDLSSASIVDGRGDKDKPQVLPPEYQGGIGAEGVAALKTFVEEGGTLIAFDDACDFAIDKFGLPVTDTLKGDKEFSCPGSILRARVDRSHPLAFGMPEETPLFFTNSPALSTTVPPRVDIDRKVIVRYDEDKDPLMSGYLNQPDKLKGRAALVEVTWGKGKIVLFAFRPQHRAQTWATYKLLFNAILHAKAVPAELP